METDIAQALTDMSLNRDVVDRKNPRQQARPAVYRTRYLRTTEDKL